MTFGEDSGWGANQDESKAMFDLFANAGGNFIDTADGYTNGTSENLLANLSAAGALNLTVTPWSPLACSWLTGKYAGKAKEERRLDKTPQFARPTERNAAIPKEVVKVAKAVGKSPAQVALNWLRARRNTIPIIGARKLSQLEDNLNCVKWSLNAKQLAQLIEVSWIESGFPGDFLDRPFVRDYLHGGMFDLIEH